MPADTYVAVIDQPLPRVPRLLLVTESTHPIGSCTDCAKAAHGAEVTARFTGSVGATYTQDARLTTGELHSATVASKR